MARVTYSPCPNCRKKGRDNAGDNLVEFADGGSHCFSCGFHSTGRGPYHRPSKTTREEVDHGSKVLPADFDRQVPVEAWQWLLQYGLSVTYWLPYVGWSETDSRLVFTVGNPVEFSIGRFIAKQDTEEKRKWFAYGDTHKTPHIFGDYRQNETVVLVEDLVSAHKVGQVFPCIPLFGTKVFDAVIPALCHIDLPIVIWLDKDQDQTMPKKCHTLSSITGLPVSYRVTSKDPKWLPIQEITSIVTNS